MKKDYIDSNIDNSRQDLRSAVSASSEFKTMLLSRKIEFGNNANICKNYFTDACAWPWYDACNSFAKRH